MIAVILVAALVAATISMGFVTFFWLKIKHEIDKFDLNFQKDDSTYTKYKNKQKQWEIEQALFDKIRRERKIESEQETAEINVQEISKTQKYD